VPAILERPLLGWGQGVYIELGEWLNGPRELVWRSAESQWLLTLMTGGLVELALLAWLLVTAWLTLRRDPSADAFLLKALLLLAVLVGVTVPVFTNVGFPLAFWTAVGSIAFHGDISNSKAEEKMRLA
jgi:hypothetical protein